MKLSTKRAIVGSVVMSVFIISFLVLVSLEFVRLYQTWGPVPTVLGSFIVIGVIFGTLWLLATSLDSDK